GAGEDTIAQLVAHAEGNAFYLEELIRATVEGDLGTPETVLAMLQARLGRLPAEARRILRAASVFGQTFWLGGVARLLDSHSGDQRMHQQVAELTDAEFIQRAASSRFARQQQYMFHHALIREATYGTLTDQDRALGHRLAGEWLEQCGETDAVVLAEHFEKGGELSKAASWYVRATQQALESDSLDDVHERAERGVSCGAKGAALGELRLAQVEALIWQGSIDAALSSALEAVQMFEAHGQRWYRGVSSLAVVCSRLGKPEPIVSVVDTLLSHTPEQVSSHYAKALATTGRALLMMGELSLLDTLRAVSQRAKSSAPHLFELWARHLYEISAEKDVAAEVAAYLSTLEAWRKAGDRRRACIESINLGYLWITLGAYDSALPLLRRSLAEARTIGSPHLIAHAQNNLGCCLAWMGRPDEALDIEAAAVAAHGELGFRSLEIGARIDLAYIYAKLGNFDRAEREARLAIEQAAAIPRLRCNALAVLSQILLHVEAKNEALKVSRESMTILEEYSNNIE
ncbi:MAG: hypothetical protein AAGC55_25575, partial [Myxococcota bacterium]